MKKINRILFLFLLFFISLYSLGFSKSDYYKTGLTYPRTGNTTTLLPNGSILVVGGHLEDGSMASTPEIYIPSKGYFDPITGVAIGVSSHTATLLPNGNVLIFGGNNNAGTSVGNAYIYNPVTNTFAASTGSTFTNYARAGHTATLLTRGTRKGRVLVCGGSKYTNGVPADVGPSDYTCFLIRPNLATSDTSLTVESVGNYKGAQRAGHTATLLSNGNVLISGGLKPAQNYEGASTNYIPGNEIYDTWDNKVIHNDDPLKIARAEHTAITMNDGRVMIIGGYNYNYSPNSSSFAPYDVSSTEDWYNSPNPGYGLRFRHSPGPHGFLGDVEFFDQNGARSSVITGDGKGLPYRVSNAAGVLSPSGLIYLHGGRGNIPVTLGAAISVTFDPGSHLRPKGTYPNYDYTCTNYICSAYINPDNSYASAPIPATKLAAPVSGRFINADIFVPYADPKTKLGIDEGTETDGGLKVSFVVNSGNTYAKKEDIRFVLDGMPVGRYIEADEKLADPPYESGVIKYDSVKAWDLDGKMTIYPVKTDELAPTQTSHGLYYIEGVGTGNNVHELGNYGSTVHDNCPGKATVDSDPVTCHGYFKNFKLYGLEVDVPGYFAGAILSGELYLDLDSIIYSVDGENTRDGRYDGDRYDEEWSSVFTNSQYVGTIAGYQYGLKIATITYSNAYASCITEENGKSCKLKFPEVTISTFTYQFTNPSTHAINWYDIPTKIELEKLSAIVTFRPSLINLEGLEYDAGASTIVVRDMLFSNTLTYDPGSGSWNTDIGIGGFYEKLAPGYDIRWPGFPAYRTALMNHSMFLDASGAPTVIGGRACSEEDEGGTAVNYCRRQITNQSSLYTSDPGVKVHHDLIKAGVVLVPNENGLLNPLRYLDDTSDAGKLNSPRQGHTSSVLPNGNILVCGGSDGNKTLDTCEVYDVKGGKWSYTGSMSTPRSGHTATLLPNGKVIIAGGTDGFNYINTSEIYNPKTGKFDEHLKPMVTARRNHTATLLPNGNVFVVGGSSLTFNEVFITTRAVWEKRYDGSDTGKLFSHESVLLKDGKVAVIGGITKEASPSGQYYIFNPVNPNDSNPSGTNLTVRTGSVGCGARFYPYKHKAIMDINGNVWVIGGTNGSSYSSDVVIYPYANGILGETNNCVAGAGLLVGNLTDGVVGHSAMIAPNNVITVFGGNTQNRTLGQHHTINTEMRSISVKMNASSSSGEDGKGGDGKAGAQSTNKYAKYDTLHNLRTNHTMVMDAEGNFYIIGGDNGKGTVYDSVEKIYFTVSPDKSKVSSNDSPRRPLITNPSDENVQPGTNLTLLSTNTMNNFHGYTEAADGTAVHHNTPRVLLQAVDMPSGFLVDVSTIAYANKDWNLMMSSITVKLPGFTGTNGSGHVNTELPWGYYYALESVNGQFTNFKRIQVGENWEIPDIPGDVVPLGGYAMAIYGGHPLDIEASTYTIYYSSIVWTWPNIDHVNYPYINGYEVYSATYTDASLGRVELNPSSYPVFISTGLPPNYPAKIKVVPYNIWTEGENFKESSIYYTLAETPVLSIDAASGNYATLNWTSNNFDGTCYEVDWCHTTNQMENCFDTYAPSRTSSGTFRSTSFDNLSCYSTTTFNTTELDGIDGYSFRVRAINGTTPALWGGHYNASGYKTPYSNIVSTINVKDIKPETIIGSPSTGTILWSWPAVDGYVVDYVVQGYNPDTGEMFPISDTTTLRTSESRVSFTQTWGKDGPVAPNRPFSIAVQPIMRDMNSNEYIGNISTSVVVYTLANAPTYVEISPVTVTKSTTTNEKVQAIVVKWGKAGNSDSTEYKVELSTQSDFATIAYSTRAYHSDDGITSGELGVNTYYYGRVFSINDAGKPSNEITYATAPVCTFTNPPGDVQISSNNVAGIGIKWDYNGNPEIYDSDGVNQIGTIYNVMISTDQSFPEGATFTDITFGNEYLFTGLLTSLEYHISVNSENQAGHKVDMEGTISTHSVTGPEGTWPGSVIGMTDPVNDKDIYGNLLTGRFVSLYVPAAAYTVPTELAISSVTFNSCGSYGSDLGGHIIAAQVFTNNPDPMVPVEFTIGYFDTEANIIEQNQDSIVLARYNSVTNSCLPLTTTINTNTKRISASVNTFDWNTSLSKGTILQVIKYVAPSTLADVQIYPNPFYPNRGDGYVQIEPVPANTKLTLYTLSGAKVWEGTSGRSSVITWDGKNKSGVRVASGIYLGVLEAPSGKKKIKIAVEK